MGDAEQPVKTDADDAVRVASALHAENERLRAALARSEGERERLQRIADGFCADPKCPICSAVRQSAERRAALRSEP